MSWERVVFLFLLPTKKNPMTFPLHRAVWDNDQQKLRDLLIAHKKRFFSTSCFNCHVAGKKLNEDQLTVDCMYCFVFVFVSQDDAVNEFDNRGNAVIHLCLMLNRRDCLKVLLEHGDPDCRLQ